MKRNAFLSERLPARPGRSSSACCLMNTRGQIRKLVSVPQSDQSVQLGNLKPPKRIRAHLLLFGCIWLHSLAFESRLVQFRSKPNSRLTRFFPVFIDFLHTFLPTLCVSTTACQRSCTKIARTCIRQISIGVRWQVRAKAIYQIAGYDSPCLHPPFAKF